MSRVKPQGIDCHCWNVILLAKEKRAREPQQLDNKWTIIRTSMDGGLDFFGSRQTTNKTIGFFLLNLPLSKAIWAHIFIVLKYKQLWEDSCAQICRYFFLKLNFIYGTCKLWQIFFGKFQFCSAFNWADHVKTLLFLPLTTTTIIIIITMPQFL